MLKQEVAETRPFKVPFYYGWVIVFMGALGYFFSGPGQTYSISIFIDHYIVGFGWSRSLVSSLYSIATLIAGLILTVVGSRVDKLGHRKMIGIISILLGLTCFGMSFISNPIMLFFGFLCLRLFGQGSMSLIPSTLVPQWFKNKRGLALSLMTVGGVVGSTVGPPLNNWLIENHSLEFAWIFWGLSLIVVMAPLGWIFVRNRPEDLGLLPDGASNIGEAGVLASKIHISNDPWTLKKAMGTRSFWLMVYCGVVSALVNTGLIFHMVSIIGEKGYSSAFAAYVLSLSALVRFPVTFVAGYLVDRMRVNLVKGTNFFLLVLALVLVLQGEGKGVLITYALIHGVFMAFDGVSSSVLWPNYFGRENLGKIRGFTMTAMVIGSSMGPLPFGIAFDLFGGYREILLMMLILPLLAIVASYMAVPPVYEE